MVVNEFDVIIDDSAELEVLIDTPELDLVITIDEPAQKKQVLFDYSEPDVVFIGKASLQANQDDDTWTVKKIEVNLDGTTTTSTATNIKWSDRLTAIYN